MQLQNAFVFLRILGPISANIGHDVNLGGPKQRLVLALLALRANHVVSVDELIDGLWNEDAPGRPRKTLQVYIAHLRGSLDSPGRIVSEPFGYRLVLGDDEFDLYRFKRLLADARAATSVDPSRAESRYREAMALWSAPALADLRAFVVVERAARPLDVLRVEAAEEHLALQVHGGRPADAVPALIELTETDPCRERPWALLMEAYYRSGCQSDALATYQRVRDLLADELGIDPGPELRRMELSVLRQDPGLGVAVPPPHATPAADERRSATFVSLGIVAFDRLAGDLDPEDLMTQVEAFRTEIRRIIGRHGGTPLAAEEGHLLACFGYPVAGEDDLCRAIRAALAAARPIAPGPIAGVSAGVHTGLAVFRTGGEAGVFGHTPALAGRLQRVTGAGDVRVSAEAVALAAGWFTFSRDGCSADGSFVVVGEKAPLAGEASGGFMRGRDAALAEIRRAVTGRRGPAVVLLLGEAGIGKTLLIGRALDELGGRRPGDGMPVLRGDRHRRDQPLHPVAAALTARYRDLAQLSLELGQAGPAGNDAVVLLPTLGELAGWAASPQPSALTGAARRRAVAAWLLACAGDHPVRLVVDDLHDVDEETRELLENVVAEMTDGVVLIASRTDDLPPRLASMACRVRLHRLREQDGRALVLHTAGARRLHTATVNQIVQRCDGHPLYLRELTLAAVAAAPSAEGAAVEVPASLRASLFARLDTLGPAKALAQRCAVVGGPFGRALAARLCDESTTSGADPATLTRELAELVAAGVLRRTDNYGEELYTYSHALLEDCAYASLPRRVRVELHRRIAEWMGSASSMSCEPGRWADHLAAAGDPGSAVGLFVQAAQQAVAAARFFESSTYLRRALHLIPQTPAGIERDRLELTASLLLAGSMLMTNFIDDEVHRLAARARDLAVPLGQPDLRHVTDLVLIAALRGLGRYDEAARHGSQALSALPPDCAPETAGGLRRFHAVTLVLTGRLAEAAELSDPDLATARSPKQQTTSPLGVFVETNTACLELSLTGLAAFTQDRPDRCDRLFAGARRIARDANAADGSCFTDLSYAITQQLVGDAPSTHGLAESSLESAIELGRDNFVIWAQVMLGWAVSVGGNPREGIKLMEEALDHTTGSRSLLPYFHAVAATVELAAGRRAEARDRALAAVRLAERTGERLLLPYIHLVTADAFAAAHSPAAEITERRRLAHDVAERQGQRWFVRRIAEIQARTDALAVI
ncbi:BTAD domain-containing putative transcriptional regulator [Catenuloplanes atrovinosus]|uniref:DNA-binding SARP family transcriptional activator n=1 Tax=Catenuloplanes atrovinosus TaxID=137266 RepID=A0AAE3YNH1_9ACTN|nr:BTAD domain-containing putative transcriptional regulator [Catenuloplanes atrovinosus]MDR7277058.1 DNA-binding SARP family transcriptional activator [Catenuloplanes atrovinosus]